MTFFREVLKVCGDEYFQTYAFSALKKRRRDPKLTLTIAFKRGKINPRDTFVQEA